MNAPFATSEEVASVAGESFRLSTLADRQQFHDPDGKHEAAGVAPAWWSLFGVTWSAGLLLAEAMTCEPMTGRRILELGAGLGLPSLVLHKRGGDVTASDVHPLAAEFFARNLANNDLPAMSFLVLDWRSPPASLGTFDLIIASDVLYEAAHIDPLAAFITNYTAPGGEFVLTDPGRKLLNAFSRRLSDGGFVADVESHGKARLARYSRST